MSRFQQFDQDGGEGRGKEREEGGREPVAGSSINIHSGKSRYHDAN